MTMSPDTDPAGEAPLGIAPFDQTSPGWTDWRWQMRHRVRSEEELRRYIRPIPDELKALEATREVFHWAITPYYASLMDPADPTCPIRRQVVPRMDELSPDLVGVVDPLEEVAHSPVKNLIHNYPDRVAFCVTAECAIYCRYCLRKRMVGDADFMMRRGELEDAARYIAGHPEIRDVLLTGGDPLTFSERQISWLLGTLREIPHVEIIRIGSRMPVKLPYRITPELCAVLREHSPVWLNTHFNHPRELTGEARAALGRLLDAGVPVGNQTVLLRGINDDAPTLKALFGGLVHSRARPYYLYQAQVIGGTAAFRTSIEAGMALMEELQGHLTGFAIPVYVLDTPFGKVPLNRSWVLGRAGDHVVMRTTRGTLWAEPNPLTDPRFEGFLPAIDMPEGAVTIPTGAEAAGVPAGPWVVPAVNGSHGAQ
jgi:lysine 2,3-aminomutase